MTKTWKWERGPTRPAKGFPWLTHRTLQEIAIKMPANLKTIQEWRDR